MDNLACVESICELYLTGNPCTGWEGYKDYVIAKVSQLRRLDGEDITKSQRLIAKQRLKQLEQELKLKAQESLSTKEEERKRGESNENAYTKESRVKLYQEMQEAKKKEEEKNKENSMFKDYYEMEESLKRREPVSVYNAFGDIRQCNEGKYEFKYSESEDKTCVILEVWVPKFLDTSLINVDL